MQDPTKNPSAPLNSQSVDARNLALNAALQSVDTLITCVSNEAEVQMGVLMMAQILAFRRLLEQKHVTNSGKRHRLVKMALRDFESKLSQHAPVATDLPTKAL